MWFDEIVGYQHIEMVRLIQVKEKKDLRLQGRS